MCDQNLKKFLKNQRNNRFIELYENNNFAVNFTEKIKDYDENTVYKINKLTKEITSTAAIDISKNKHSDTECIYYMFKKVVYLNGTCKGFMLNNTNSDISWPSNIIVHKKDIQSLENIQIEINETHNITIDLKLLIKLCAIKLNEDLILIKIPKNLIISKSIEQSKLHNTNHNLMHFYGIPISWLYKTCIFLKTSKKINCCIIINDTQLLTCDTEIRDLQLTMDTTTYKKVTYDMIKDTNYMLLCIKCFKDYLSKHQIAVINEIYKMLKYMEIFKMDILLKSLCELIIEYAQYDHIIIYITHDTNNTTYYKLIKQNFIFDKSYIAPCSMHDSLYDMYGC
jgi:hypothetical protein